MEVQKEHGKISEVMNMFIILIVAMISNISKIIKLYNLKYVSLLPINYTSMKLYMPPNNNNNKADTDHTFMVLTVE